jgi:hypothetical protein
MRFLILFILIAIGVLSLGAYRGWFNVASDSTAGTSNLTVTVDKAKVKQDANMAKETAKDLEHRVQDEARVALDKGNHPATQP